jgi:predicted nucleic acid-binding protein
MPLLISDANILIDMQCGELLDRMFDLDHEFAVLDVLFDEELRANHADLLDRGLRVLTLTGKGVVEGVDLIRVHARTGASRNDLLTLALAIQENCALLTGDRRLRGICEALGREVRGTLWLVEEMHNAGLISRAQASAAYEAMKAQGRRLPWHEVEVQLRQMRRR